jgi:hypothetical protein
MAAHLHAGEVAVHAFVIGEIALGHLRQRRTSLPTSATFRMS